MRKKKIHTTQSTTAKTPHEELKNRIHQSKRKKGKQTKQNDKQTNN